MPLHLFVTHKHLDKAQYVLYYKSCLYIQARLSMMLIVEHSLGFDDIFRAVCFGRAQALSAIKNSLCPCMWWECSILFAYQKTDGKNWIAWSMERSFHRILRRQRLINGAFHSFASSSYYFHFLFSILP